MPGMTIRKGDTVQVIAGKDRGLVGRVIAVLPEESRVIVNLNLSTDEGESFGPDPDFLV